MRRLRGMLATTVTALIILGCTDDHSSDAPVLPNPAPSVLFPIEAEEFITDDEREVQFVLQMDIGDADGPAAFGHIMDVAVSNDSIVAVADRFGCMVRLFAFPAGESLHDIGGCGDGPGEFRQIASIAFKGDTLLVYDAGRSTLVRLDRTGEELARDQVPFDPTGSVFSMISATGDAIAFAPAWRLGTGPNYSAYVYEDTGDGIWGIPAPEIALVNSENMLREWTGPCFFRQSTRLAAFNRWAAELVLTDRSLRPRRRHVESAWFSPESTDELGWRPPGSPPRVSCGDSVAVWAYRKNDPSSTPADRRVQKGILFVATDEGVLLQSDIIEDAAWPDLITLTPADGLGRHFFFFQNGWGPYPSVRAYELHY